MTALTKDRIFRFVLIAYMAGVSLFGYVVLSTPPDVEAQCRNITFCTSGAAGGCCASGGTGAVLTGIRYNGQLYYSEICVF